MKRLVCALMAISIIFAGCGKKPTVDENVATTPTSTPTVTATPTPLPTATPTTQPTQSAEPTSKPQATSKPTSTSGLTNSKPTKKPIATIKPTKKPVATVKPEETPKPTETPAPNNDKFKKVGDTYVESVGFVDTKNVEIFANKLNSLKEKYFNDKENVWYAIVPDKTNYAKEHLETYIDHEVMTDTLKPLLSDWKEIPIGDLLTLEDYYLTDGHWQQDKLLPLVDRIGSHMGFTIDKSLLEHNSFDNFIGHYGKYIPDIAPEKIHWLTSIHTEQAVVENFQNPKIKKVYDVDKLNTNGMYDLFLSGATPLTVIKNPNATTDKNLIIFRDSFGSSIAPLFIEPYSRVTLVDIRYMVSDLLGNYVDFSNSDILFLYGGQIVNNSKILR